MTGMQILQKKNFHNCIKKIIDEGKKDAKAFRIIHLKNYFEL